MNKLLSVVIKSAKGLFKTPLKNVWKPVPSGTISSVVQILKKVL